LASVADEMRAAHANENSAVDHSMIGLLAHAANLSA
jgi:hypothetical protein